MSPRPAWTSPQPRSNAPAGGGRTPPGLEFVHAEACDYLTSSTTPFDAVYSVWGAVWFTDPELLFPLVARNLTPGGIFAFSQAEPSPGAYGPQPMHGKWLEGRESELTVLRWQYTPQAWADLLKHHGFTDIDARILPAPGGEGLGTLLVRSHARPDLPFGGGQVHPAAGSQRGSPGSRKTGVPCLLSPRFGVSRSQSRPIADAMDRYPRCWSPLSASSRSVAVKDSRTSPSPSRRLMFQP
ncbi:methyltransferase domain-containing protein [Streptomyces arboris]|uniref:methyltransferase domain-containing protein n=1 Tax=Streptomyces arboris TaxID=2600619 RepID=UPI001CEFA637|nr:methyltransferase domain-containing protein [Streptomyces arboris]